MVSLDIDYTQKLIHDLQTKKAPGWQEEAIGLIRKARLDDPLLELNRLRKYRVIDAETESRLDDAIQMMPYMVSSEKRLQIQVMMGRAMEIQKIYEATHHVLIHAQSRAWLVFPDLVKEFMKINHPEKDLHQFKFLRLPQDAGAKKIQMYSDAERVSDTNRAVMEDLISADGYFYNYGRCESALWFMSLNYNIFEQARSLIGSTIREFYPEMASKKVEAYVDRVMEISQSEPSSESVGNLFAFVIPKETSDQIQYRAHPYGTRCSCHKEKEDGVILEELQKGLLHRGNSCPGLSSPQYRIFTPMLKKENLHIYLIPSDRAARRNVKERIRAIVQEIHAKESWEARFAANERTFSALV